MLSSRVNLAFIGIMVLIAQVAQATTTTVQGGITCGPSNECLDINGVGWYNPYEDFPSYSGGTSLSNIDNVCDDPSIMATAEAEGGTDKLTDNPKRSECLCKPEMRDLLGSGVELVKNPQSTEYDNYAYPYYDTVPYVKVGCALDICKEEMDERWAQQTGGDAEAGIKVASCVCVATSTYEVIRDDHTAFAGGQQGTIDVNAYTAEEQARFEAFCAIQDCYDTMQLLKQVATGFKGYCDSFPQPSELPPSTPAEVALDVTVDSTVEAFDDAAQTSYCDGLKLLTGASSCTLEVEAARIRRLSSGLVVTSKLGYASDALATMASEDIEVLSQSSSTMTSQLGVPVQGVAVPTVAAQSPSIPPSAPPSDGDSGLSTGALAGIIVGGVVGVLIIGFVVFKAFCQAKGGDGAKASKPTPQPGSTTSV